MDIKTLRLYLDSSIIQGYCDSEFSSWSKCLLDDCRKELYKPVVSALTADEITSAPVELKNAFAAWLKLNPKIVEVTEKAETLADLYLDRHIVPLTFRRAALHVALATLEEVDVLVSWNYKYIVHYSRLRQYITVNLELGLRPIQIRTPKAISTLELEKPD